MPQQLNIVLFGIGNVGSTLIRQVQDSRAFFLKQHGIALHFPVITNSSHAFFSKDGAAGPWELDFSRASVPYKPEDIINYVRGLELENLIAVDATASSALVQYYIPLIQNGFHIVTANKVANTLPLDFYRELRRILKAADREFLYETNVGAGLPVVGTVADLYQSGEPITKIRGVFSGSLSYIFNRFGREDLTFSEILRDAERNGYTEPDSRDDLSGQDVARKLLILAREAGSQANFEDIRISSLLLPELNQSQSKAHYAVNKELLDAPYRVAKLAQSPNHVLRYVGELDLVAGTLETKLVSEPVTSAIGQLTGADSLIEIYTQSYGANPIVIRGAGAGREVTARGVLSDILRVARTLSKRETAII